MLTDLIKRASEAKPEVSEGERAVVAVITTDTVDRMGEVIVPKGIDLKRFREYPVVLWCHRADQPPIGKALWVKPTADGRGLVAKVQFATTPFASEIFSLYQQEVLRAFSVGCTPVDDAYGPPSPAEIRARPDLAACRRMWRKTAMHEFSACSIGMNPDALSLAVSKGLVVSEAIRRDFPAQAPPAAPALPSLAGYRTLARAIADRSAQVERHMADRIDLLRGRV